MLSFTNLYVGYNEAEDFRILIVAYDEDEALATAEHYGRDSQFAANKWAVEEAEHIDCLRFDCDTVITAYD